MSKFIGYTIGLECNGHGTVGKLVKVCYSEQVDGSILLQAESARNMAPIRGAKAAISQAEYQDRPSDAYDSTVEAMWALDKVGFMPMALDKADA